METREFDVYPAIDLRNGQVVRLVQGDPQRQTIYDTNPAAVAKRWIDAGARWLHVVNLDGAFDETMVSGKNWACLAEIVQVAKEAGVRVQSGGGLRTLSSIEKVLEMGVQRAILGTAAVENPELAAKALRSFGIEAVGVSIDAYAGIVKTRGWQHSGGINALALARRLAQDGLRTVIYTDIARDGLAVGPNLAACSSLAADLSKEGKPMSVIVSGGVHILSDISSVRQAGLSGVIIGRALYQGDFTLEDALSC